MFVQCIEPPFLRVIPRLNIPITSPPLFCSPVPFTPYSPFPIHHRLISVHCVVVHLCVQALVLFCAVHKPILTIFYLRCLSPLHLQFLVIDLQDFGSYV